MTDDRWPREYMGVPTIPTEESRDLLRRWLTYFVETEEYDRGFPGRWSPHERDCWLPRPEYTAAVEGFARNTMGRLRLSDGRSPEREQALRMTYTDAKAYLAREAARDKETL